MAPGSKKKKNQGVTGIDPNARSVPRRRPLTRGSKKRREKGAVKGTDPTASLPDDILAEIISRVVPSDSVCSCKCVCTRWRDLPDHRSRMPQPLAGFFHKGTSVNPNRNRHFTNVSRRGDPIVDVAFPFLPRFDTLDFLDCCNGLLLCRCQRWMPAQREILLYYVVCNPATQKWVDVPATKWTDNRLRRTSRIIVSDTEEAVVSDTDDDVWEKEQDVYDRHVVKQLATYSSKAGTWTCRSVAGHKSFAIGRSRSAFLDGVLYLAAFRHTVLAVDVEGDDWQLIRNPEPQHHPEAHSYNVFPSQGRLYLAQGNAGCLGSELSVWVLEDRSAGEWTLKHNVSNDQLFRAHGTLDEDDYTVISFHPERNSSFTIINVSDDIELKY
ncbi:uncharacterized protein [Lolium perenne]|uniref:uncharacterized protein n=1 Tax=Lolium perenne TaxID=4522 RepID=UPI0021F5F56E|nr:uncharacterized protein LOC127303166 [Lolium perenne]